MSNDTSGPRANYLYALTVRHDQDGSIPVERHPETGWFTRDPFTAIRNVAMGYNYLLSGPRAGAGGFWHAGEISAAALQQQDQLIPAQIDRLRYETPNAQLLIGDYGEMLATSAADCREGQPEQWRQFAATLNTYGNGPADAEYERRVRAHLMRSAITCRREWNVPFGYPTFPGTRLYMYRGKITRFLGYPVSGEIDYLKHPLQTENDRCLKPIFAAVDKVIVQAGYFDRQWDPDFEEPYWAPVMQERQLLPREDMERFILSHLQEALRVAMGHQEVLCMATPMRRPGVWINRATWHLLEDTCRAMGIRIVLWMAFQDLGQIRGFLDWCGEMGITLPGEVWIPEPMPAASDGGEATRKATSN